MIVGFGDRIAMEETLENAIARVFGGPGPPPGGEVAPTSRMGTESSVITLLGDAASALARASDELRRVRELLRQLRGAEQGSGSRGGPSKSSGTPR